jgi:predicted Zn-dependent protease
VDQQRNLLAINRSSAAARRLACPMRFHRSEDSVMRYLSSGWRWFAPCIGLVGALGLGGCVHEPSAVTGERQAYGYSWQQELQLGQESDRQLTEQFGLYEDAEVQRYVETVGRRVLETSDLRGPETPELYQNTQFTFRVLDSPVVNAFALPGGYVYVTRGLLTHLQNEAQLAVVLGHEIGHVAARHASQQARRAQLAQLGLVAGAIVGQQVFGQQGGDVASNILNLGGQALQLLMFRYSREAERESDELGVRYAAQSGYAAAEGSDFFRSLTRLSEREGRALPSWSATHPDPAERAERVRELSASWTPIGATAQQVNEAEFLRRLEGMVLGENPREGFRRDNQFIHPALKFQFPVPPGWRLQNERALVAMAEPNGQAVIGFEIVPARTPRDAVAQLAQKAQQVGLELLSATDLSINGLPATLVLARANTQQGQIGVVATFIQHLDNVYSFVGYAPAQIFAQARPTFEYVASGFAPVTDPAILALEPARVGIVEVEREAKFREMVPAVMPPGLTVEELAIINQVDLNERLPLGRRLKLPR